MRKLRPNEVISLSSRVESSNPEVWFMQSSLHCPRLAACFCIVCSLRIVFIFFNCRKKIKIIFHHMWELFEIQILVPTSKMYRDTSMLIGYVSSMSAFGWQRQSWAVVTETIWAPKLKYLLCVLTQRKLVHLHSTSFSLRVGICWSLTITPLLTSNFKNKRMTHALTSYTNLLKWMLIIKSISDQSLSRLNCFVRMKTKTKSLT